VTESIAAFKKWANNSINPNNELLDAINMEPDQVASMIEVTIKIASYYNMIEAKAKRIRRGTVT
jgi:hypothetical protein